VALLSACASHRAVEETFPSGWAWPPDDPRIRLERAVDLDMGSRSTRGRMLKWIGDENAAPLIQRPYAVAWDGEELLVTDPGAHRVARIARRGEIDFSPPGALVTPMGIAACSAGILVTDSEAGRVVQLGGDLQLDGWLAEDLSRPTGIACRDGTVFVVETGRHRILVLEADGSRRVLGKRGSAPGEFNFPTSLTLDGGDLLVGDTLNFRIQRLEAATGKPVSSFGGLGDSPGETPRIKGVAVDARGRIWVSDGYLDRISLYEPDGVLLISIGSRGSGPGEFSFPAGIAAHPDGQVAVVDSLNRRLQVFRLIE
jgi:DNA-binding beta-propeller fold protein YncE